MLEKFPLPEAELFQIWVGLSDCCVNVCYFNPFSNTLLHSYRKLMRTRSIEDHLRAAQSDWKRARGYDRMAREQNADVTLEFAKSAGLQIHSYPWRAAIPSDRSAVRLVSVAFESVLATSKSFASIKVGTKIAVESASRRSHRRCGQ
jgi:hypothetical protein